MTTIGSSGSYVAAMMSSMQSMRPSASQLADNLLSSADTDGNGSISEAEFSSLLQNTDSSVSSDTASSLFAQLDTNGDGNLSSQETTSAIDNLLAQMRQQTTQNTNGMGGMPPPPPPVGDSTQAASDFMSAADTNNDGSISKSEFTAALQNANSANADTSRIDAMFADADSNGDGSISASELKTAMANHQPPPPPPPPDSNNSSTSTSSSTGNSSDSTDQVGALVQALLNQYQIDNQNSSTVSVTA